MQRELDVLRNSGFKAVEKGSPTLHREFTHACDLHGKSCLLAPVLISIYIWERFMQFLSFAMFRQDPMLPLCLDAAVSRGRPYVLQCMVNVHLLLNQSVHCWDHICIASLSLLCQPMAAASYGRNGHSDSQSESQRAFHNVGHALESLSTFWKLRDRDIPERCEERFIRGRLPLHKRFPMPIVLKIMKYMETRRHVEQTKAVIGKIDEAIYVMVGLRSLMNYNLSYEHSLRLHCKVKLQDYNTEPLAAQSSGDVYRSIRGLERDFCFEMQAIRADTPLGSSDAFLYRPPRPGVRCVLERLREAKDGVRDLLVEQIRAMMSGSTKVFFFL